MNIFEAIVEGVKNNLAETGAKVSGMFTSPEAWQQFLSIFGLSQFMIALLGFIAIAFATSKNEKLRRRACLFGLAGQPFWIYSTLHTGSIGMFLITIGYTVVWGRAVWLTYLADKFKKK